MSGVQCVDHILVKVVYKIYTVPSLCMVGVVGIVNTVVSAPKCIMCKQGK